MYFCCIVSMQVAVLLLAFFSSFRTTNCKVAVLPRIHIFDNISFKSKPLQMKLIPKLHSNILGILTSKRRGAKAFNQCRTNTLQWYFWVWTVPAGKISQWVCSIQQEFYRHTHMDNILTYLCTNSVRFKGRNSLKTFEKKKRLTHPTTFRVGHFYRFTW